MVFASQFKPPLLLAFSLAFMFSGCTVVVDESGPLPPGPGLELCTREYAPVCARRGGERQTFANACRAEQAGYRILDVGECRRREEPRLCTREYAPVCALRGGERRTFSNDCEADVAGYRVISNGECRRRDDDEERVSACTREYAPVCARRGQNVRTFGNECEARSNDFRIIADGPC